jgi:two-component system cell cycle sensor histidine kinase/response regulator CckA
VGGVVAHGCGGSLSVGTHGSVAAFDLYHCLFDEAADGVFVADAAGRYIAVNDRGCELTGYTREELLAMRVSDLVDPEDLREQPLRIVELSRGKPILSERVIRCKGGGRLNVEISGRQLSDGNLLGTLRDLTQRKRLEAELRASEQRFRSLVQNSMDVIGLYAADGTILYHSPAVHRVLGYLPESLTGASLYWFVHPDDRATARAEHLQLMASPNSTLRAERRYRHADGSYRWIEIVAANLLDDPNVGALVKNYRDITDRRQKDAERERLQQELQQAQKMDSLGRLAGGVAHDFNNLLMVILGNVESGLFELPAEHSLRPRLLEIRDAALRSVDLTGGLLAFARKQARAPRVLDINAAISATLTLLQRLIGSRIEIDWRPDPRAWPVRLDASQLDQILTNLVVNARDAIEHQGVIRIATRNVSQERDESDETSDWVRISVSDTGAGMDAETLARAFEPFFTTKEEGRGTGLGLATVYGIVTQNAGRVQLHSELEQGTTFEIDLPRHR